MRSLHPRQSDHSNDTKSSVLSNAKLVPRRIAVIRCSACPDDILCRLPSLLCSCGLQGRGTLPGRCVSTCIPRGEYHQVFFFDNLDTSNGHCQCSCMSNICLTPLHLTLNKPARCRANESSTTHLWQFLRCSLPSAGRIALLAEPGTNGFNRQKLIESAASHVKAEHNWVNKPQGIDDMITFLDRCITLERMLTLHLLLLRSGLPAYT